MRNAVIGINGAMTRQVWNNFDAINFAVSQTVSHRLSRGLNSLPHSRLEPGANGQNRTDDPRFTKALLYRLSYVGAKRWETTETQQNQAFRR